MKAIDRLLKLDGEKLEIFKILDGSVTAIQYADCNVEDGSCIVGTFGRGATVDEAAEDYCNKISGKTLVFRFYKTTQKEVTVLF